MVPHSRGCHSGDRQVMALSRSLYGLSLPSAFLLSSCCRRGLRGAGEGREERASHPRHVGCERSKARGTRLLYPPCSPPISSGSPGGQTLASPEGRVLVLSFVPVNSKKNPRDQLQTARTVLPPSVCPDFGARLPAGLAALLSPARRSAGACPLLGAALLRAEKLLA